MKLIISKHKKVTKESFFGGVVEEKVWYTIDRVIFYFFKMSLDFYRYDRGIGMIPPPSEELVEVRYRPEEYAYMFDTYEDAKTVLDDMYNNPNKYVKAS